MNYVLLYHRQLLFTVLCILCILYLIESNNVYIKKGMGEGIE